MLINGMALRARSCSRENLGTEASKVCHCPSLSLKVKGFAIESFFLVFFFFFFFWGGGRGGGLNH